MKKRASKTRDEEWSTHLGPKELSSPLCESYFDAGVCPDFKTKLLLLRLKGRFSAGRKTGIL